MKKFTFKLETVLKLKQRAEEERQHRLRQAQRLQDAAQSEAARCQEQLAQTLQEYEQSIRQTFDRYRANDYYQYLLWLQQKRREAEANLQRCLAETAVARQALLAATQERKILEKLKEKAYQEYLADEQRAETEFLDELGTGRFARKDNGELGG